MVPIVVLIALGALLVVADLAASGAVERGIAARVQQSGGLPARPEVEVRGRPFLVQALRGRYDEIVVRAQDVPTGQLRLAEFEATLAGAQVPLSGALSGDVSAVPVEALRARVLVAYAELGRRLGAAEVDVQPAGDLLRLTGRVEVLGQSLSVAAESTVALSEGAIVVTAQSFDVGSEAVNDLLTQTLRGQFDLRIPVEGLPYGLVPSGLEVTERGLVLDAFASDTVITR